jgi:galactofuranosylgalactofuranosylrhamnosyl-N-acetylglucosaminyl-diphospho-decaprenol beta-1,5/1,6-galactofuranosyltransferase
MTQPSAQPLQHLVLPNLDVAGETSLYVRPNARAWVEMRRGCVHFEQGGTVTTDTFYNALTVAAWKGRCGLQTLALALGGEGEFVVTIGLHRSGQATAWLDEQVLRLEPQGNEPLPVRGWSGIQDGLLFVHLRALGTAQLTAASWLTADAPRRDVTLGIVITHFNRQQQVLPAIARIRSHLARRDELHGRVTLTVVDNSRNLPLASADDVTVLPNRNFGGTGGFVRGLLSLIDGGRHTHALFMDDDASCEVESIGRCHALLRHAHDDTSAVAGALLREAAPWQLVEKGARFDGQVRAIAKDLDMRRTDDLLTAERPQVAPDYGAWWFFAFPIAAVRSWPFPFFVRGDDILFGLQNRFRIITMNGIACLGEDFAAKHNPLTAYLDARYHLALALMLGQRVTRRIGFVAGRLFLKALTSYHYSSARAVTLAVRHVLQGPEFFRDNLDLKAVREEIAGWTPNEKLLPIDPTAHAVRGARVGRESRARRLLRLVTLQGFLLPDALLKQRTTVQEKAFHGSAGAVYRYKRVLYLHGPSSTGYLAEYDRARFFGAIADFVRAMTRLMREQRALQRAYAQGADALTKAPYWRAVFSDERMAVGRSNGSAAAPRAASEELVAERSL